MSTNVSIRAQFLVAAIATVLMLYGAYHSHYAPALRDDVRPRASDIWMQFHQKLVGEISNADAYQLLFYGDSITEEWRGTSGDVPSSMPGCPEGEGILKKHFGDYRRAAIAIAGDTTGNLLWRLLNGETPAAAHAPQAAVILIGTNDLGISVTAEGIPGSATQKALVNYPQLRFLRGGHDPRSIRQMVTHLRSSIPSTKLLMVAILPRGWRDGIIEWPNPFAEAIGTINAVLKDLSEADSQVSFVDCGGRFIEKGKILITLMPDALHPNGPGLEALGQCLEPGLKPLISEV